jgi:hypothetical protein
MRKKGENSVKCAGKSAIPPDETMISPLVAKVNPSPPRGSGLLGAGDSRRVIVRGDWDTAQPFLNSRPTSSPAGVDLGNDAVTSISSTRRLSSSVSFLLSQVLSVE